MEISNLINIKPGPKIQEVKPGDIVKVSYKVKEGEKERFQSFQGVIIRVKKGENNANFMVRRVSYGVGVERTFFYSSPNLEKIEVMRQAIVRRARLFYLRKLSTSASRLKEKRREKPLAEIIAPPAVEALPEAAMVAQPVAEQAAQDSVEKQS